MKNSAFSFISLNHKSTILYRDHYLGFYDSQVLELLKLCMEVSSVFNFTTVFDYLYLRINANLSYLEVTLKPTYWQWE